MSRTCGVWPRRWCCSKVTLPPSAVVGFMPSFKCADIGMDCKFTAKALTKNGLMRKVAEHAADVHKITSMPDDLRAKIESAIK